MTDWLLPATGPGCVPELPAVFDFPVSATALHWPAPDSVTEQPAVSPAAFLLQLAATDPLPALQRIYQLVSVTEGSPPRHRLFTARSELIEELKLLRSNGLKTTAYVFCGERLRVTSPPFSYLMDGDQSFPLFDVPAPRLDDDDDNADLVDVDELAKRPRPAGYDELTLRAAAEATAADPLPAAGGALPIDD